MTAFVTVAVLVSALCHASWNALIRIGGDKITGITLLISAGGLIALPGLFAMPLPAPAAWPFLIASVIIHTGYNTFLALAYHHGELSRVYPLVRGSAPLLTLLVASTLLHEPVGFAAAAGILVLGLGIMALALEAGWRSLVASPRGLAYAAATSLCISAYTLSDGLGARAAGNAHSYVAWLFALECLPLLAAMLVLRRPALLAAARTDWQPALLGGGLSVAAYWIAIWAMTVAPIPIVAALRETSIVFAVLIGMWLLGERMTRIRALSIATVLCGLLLMRL